MPDPRAFMPLPPGTVSCPPCNGTGMQPGILQRKCPLCKGEGILPNSRSHLPKCRFCDGSGRERGTGFVLCKECEGWAHREWKPAVVDPTAPKSVDQLVAELGVRDVVSAAREGPTVVQIEAGKPRTAHLEVAKLLQTLAGEIRICDPYYGQGSLLRLDQLTSATAVKFLTQKPDGKEKSFLPKAIEDFVTERPHFEFREHAGNEIHDRYMVTEDELIILGHGLKDIGNKESFVVRLDRSTVGDLIDTLRESFDQKWLAARPIP